MSTTLPAPVRRNDWSVLTPADQVAPTLSVSVVIPAYGGQDRLDLTLAALAAQTYPASLTEVVVVDDGSQPPLRLPGLRPENCRLVRAPDSGWGRAHACHTGAAASSGQVLHWLDADMLPYPDHVAEQLRWHHVADYLVTIGWKRLVPSWDAITPEQVHAEAVAGRLDRLFPAEVGQPHTWVEQLIDSSDDLRSADAEAFRAAVGATAALHRTLYEAAGGMDSALRLGEDSELGYRLAQRGAVFVPVRSARSWHLGLPTATARADEVRRYNRPHLADRMPLPRFRRPQAGRSWRVPYVEVAVQAGASRYDEVSLTVDSALAGSLSDLTVRVVGPWEATGEGRTPPLDRDDDSDLRLLRAHVGGDPRVGLVEQLPDTAFPATFRLEVGAGHVLGHHTVSRLVAAADRARAGLVEVAADGSTSRLWRTAAVERARHLMPGEDLAAAVTQVWGRTTVTDREVGLLVAGRLDARDRRLLLGHDGVRAMPAGSRDLGGTALARRAPAAVWRRTRRLLGGHR